MRAQNGDPSAPTAVLSARAIPSKTSARFCKTLCSLFSHLISFIQNLHPVADTQRAPLLVGHRARRSQARRVDANPLVPLGIRTGNGRGGGMRLSSEHQYTIRIRTAMRICHLLTHRVRGTQQIVFSGKRIPSLGGGLSGIVSQGTGYRTQDLNTPAFTLPQQ